MGSTTSGQAPSNPTPAQLAIALGDPAGIGAEVTLKALARAEWRSQQPLLVGCRRWLETSYQMLKPEELSSVEKLSILILSEAHGAAVREVKPPAQ